MERRTLVTRGDVSLKLTLTAKQLQKPFDQAVIAPFLKAYSKRVGAAATLEDVTCVKVDDVMIGDMTIAASVVLLAVLVVSGLTEALGLSTTLGASLASPLSPRRARARALAPLAPSPTTLRPPLVSSSSPLCVPFTAPPGPR